MTATDRNPLSRWRKIAPAVVLIVAWLGIFVSPAAAQIEKRVALVIGNAAYQNVDPLPNPAVDAKAMANLFRQADLDVIEAIDLGRQALMAKLAEFSADAEGADMAVLYYAGHGAAVNGKNYMIPVDFAPESEIAGAIEVDATLAQMSSARVKLIFFDACRDNPFRSQSRATAVRSGFAPMQADGGTVIVFSTSPGAVALDGPPGGNSPFAHALLNHIATPGLDIHLALTRVRAEVADETGRRQTPWTNINLIGSVALRPKR